jgi:predicted transcriptional regulator
MRNRGRISIISQILEASKNGATKSKIMFKAFLSYPQTKTYLSLLVANGLLEHDKDEDEYRVTGKGLEFVRVLQSVDNDLEVT